MKSIHRFYQFIFRYPKSFLIGHGLLMLSFVLQDIQPLFVKWLTQTLQHTDLTQSIQVLVWFIISLIASNVLTVAGYYISDVGMVKASTDILKYVLFHIHDLDFAYHTNKSSGKLIGQVKRGAESYYSYYENLNRQLLEVSVGFIVMVIAFTSLRFMYIGIALTMFIVTILCSLFLVKINLVKRKAFNKMDDELNAAIADNLVNFDTVKYFAKENYEQKRFTLLSNKWIDVLLDYFFTFRYFDIVIGNIVNILIVGLIGTGIFDFYHKSIGLPDFLLIVTFALTLSPRLTKLLFIQREIARRHNDLEEYLNVMDEKVTVDDPKQDREIDNPKGTISFKDMGFAYGSSHKQVISDFNLDISSGESVAFVGYSGAGKTTVIKLLMRMYDTSKGSITIDGVDIKDMKKAYIRSLIGIVPQDPLMFNNTVRYNVAYAKPDATQSEIDHAVKVAQAYDFIMQLPDKFETKVGERGIKLSGGQRQRLAIARVILENPQIVIFDEATSSLDSASERAIQTAFWEIVKDSKQPKTSIIIAHRLSTIMRADRIVVMEDGKIAEVGSHDELLKNTKGIYHKLWSLQKDGFIGDDEHKDWKEEDQTE